MSSLATTWIFPWRIIISNATTIEDHLHNLLLDLSSSSWISRIEDEGALRTIRLP